MLLKLIGVVVETHFCKLARETVEFEKRLGEANAQRPSAEADALKQQILQDQVQRLVQLLLQSAAA